MNMFQRSALAIASAVIALAVVPVTAIASSISIDTDDCNVESQYSLELEGDGIAFSNKDASPKHVRLDRGRLFIDGSEIALSAADRHTIGNIEDEVLGITSEAIVIASEGIDIAFDALSEVSIALVEDSNRQTDLLRSMEKTRALVQTQIRDAVLRHPFDENAFEALIESQIETLASELVKVVVGEFVPRAIAAAFSGDEAAVAAIEARADKLEHEIETKVEAKAKQIEQRVEALCPRVKSLVDLEASLTVRLSDGSKLNLIEN
jgi:Protein of unknown function (DUF2884)